MRGLLSATVVLFASIVMFSQESSPQTPKIKSEQKTKSSVSEQQKNNQSQPDTIPSRAAIADLPATIKCECNAEQGHQEGSEFWPPLLGYRLKITDTLLVVFTFGVFMATGLLWCSTRELVSGAKDTAQRQLRAYISINAAAVVLDGRTLRAAIDLKNSGQTPAYDVITKSRMGTLEAGKPFNLSLTEDVEVSKLIVGAGVVINPDAQLEIPANNATVLPALQNGGAVIYVFGRTEYRDIFGYPHRLYFRLRSNRFEGGQWILQPTPEGNEEPGLSDPT